MKKQSSPIGEKTPLELILDFLQETTKLLNKSHTKMEKKYPKLLEDKPKKK